MQRLKEAENSGHLISHFKNVANLRLAIGTVNSKVKHKII